MASSEGNHHHASSEKQGDDGQEDLSIVSFTTTRRVMKHLMDTKTVSNEAVACLSKATEVFMINFITATARSAAEAHPSSNELRYEDVARVVKMDPGCEFLAEIIPQMPPKQGKGHNYHNGSNSLVMANSAGSSSGAMSAASNQVKRVRTTK